MSELTDILIQVTRIADALDIIARAGAPVEPGYIKPIGEYAGFDWTTIGATVVSSDKDGPTHLEHSGFVWTRRSPANKYSPAVWFSRANGKDADGNTKYLKLITFREISDADPIPDKVAAAIPSAAVKPAQPGNGHAPSASVPANGNGKQDATTANNGNPTVGKKPADEAPSGPYGATKYYQEATSKRYGLTSEWARKIAGMSGIDLKVKNPSFTPAAKLLPFFAEGKATGLDFDALAAILKECRFDPQTAAIKMRGQSPQ